MPSAASRLMEPVEIGIAVLRLVAEADEGALAELAVDLLERLLQGLELFLLDGGHAGPRFLREDGGL
jgi:hypothetical protein